MVDVTVIRRTLKKDYFQQSSGGYITSGGTPAPTIHREMAYLTELESEVVEITFGKPFSNNPIGDVPKVYRYFQNAANEWVKQDVVHFYTSEDWLTLEGFSLTIDLRYESLTGVIVEYNYTE